MKAKGNIKIEEDLELKDPTLEISKVNYDWINHTVDVECLFTEGVYKHSRTFTFNTDGSGELTTDDIISFVNGHPKLKVFK